MQIVHGCFFSQAMDRLIEVIWLKIEMTLKYLLKIHVCDTKMLTSLNHEYVCYNIYLFVIRDHFIFMRHLRWFVLHDHGYPNWPVLGTLFNCYHPEAFTASYNWFFKGSKIHFLKSRLKRRNISEYPKMAIIIFLFHRKWTKGIEKMRNGYLGIIL